MRYLGGFSGSGVLKSDGENFGRATYDFDGYFKLPAGITSNGEIQLSAPVLKTLFGRKGVQLLTDDGCLLNLVFSEKQPVSSSGIAHVEVTGDFPDSLKDPKLRV